MHKKVLFAAKLYDDLSGKNLKGNQCLFYIDGIKEDYIYKSDGYYVFLDKGKHQFQLEVKAEAYMPFIKKIDVDQLDKSMPELEIRLMPTRKSTTYAKVVEGKIAHGNRELWLFPQTKKAMMKFGGTLKDQPKIMKINLLSPASIVQLNLGCLDQEKDEFDIFRVRQKLEHNIYQIDRPLHRKYVMGTEVVRVYHTVSQEDGSYLFYLDDFYETDAFLLIYEEESKLQKMMLHQ